ncbi:MAG: carboxypeptidase-like regulatory domain-containing protein [Chitinophagaceae bacterium]
MQNKIRLQVAEPCHENWNQMTTADQGRFCQSCQKTVTDFSMMNDKEILHYLSNKGADTCGRFTNNQLNRTLVSDYKKKYSWSYVWNIVLATFLTTSAVNAQTKPAAPKKTTVSKKKAIPKQEYLLGAVAIVNTQQNNRINGVVIDSKTNEPIPFASIFIKEINSGIAADSNGKFSLNTIIDSTEITITVSAIGYTEQEYRVNNKGNTVNFYLDPKVQLLGEVEVIATPPPIRKELLECTSVTVGLMVTTKEISISEKIKRQVVDFTPVIFKKKEVQIYPNPVVAGSIVMVSLSVYEPGNYSLELLNEDGHIVYREQITMQSKAQSLPIPTNISWSKGIYWVRVSGNNSKKIYTAKLAIQ